MQPIAISAEQEGEVVEFGAQRRWIVRPARQFRKLRGGKPMSLKFPQQQTQLLSEAREPGGGAKDLQFALLLQQQRAQHHYPTFLTQRGRRRDAQVVEDKLRQALEREDVQPGVTGQSWIREQLALKLKRRLFGREEYQRRAVRRRKQRGVRISARQWNVLPLPAGPRRKRACTRESVPGKWKRRKGIYFSAWAVFVRAGPLGDEFTLRPSAREFCVLRRCAA